MLRGKPDNRIDVIGGKIFMSQIFDFSNIKNSESAIRNTWLEFRRALSDGKFTYQEINKAKQCTFLKVYDDLFHQNSGIEHKTIVVNELKDRIIGRGTILENSEKPDYERFIPKKEYIKVDNRFSPPGVEWLYLAVGTDDEIHQCAQAECRVQKGQRFGFCHFSFSDRYDDLKLVDLTIADNTSYSELNQRLENYGQTQVKKGLKLAKSLGFVPKYSVDQDEFKNLFIEWSVFTYTKLLSEQLFVPLSETDDKSKMYTPFQTMAQYYISLGYSGIIYGSTVSAVGKNIVLFDKSIAYPTGKIEDYTIL